ncbi:MAG: bifunctional phosphoglucose/phosphomannose isomerase [Chloroflexia bacterium]
MAGILDREEVYRRFDPSEARKRIFDLAGQCREAWRIVQAWQPSLLAFPPRAVVVAGMGGSAIGGDLLAALARDLATVPIFVHRNYGLPAWTNAQTLVLASSYSGNTEETLSSAAEAFRRGAPLVAVTTDGELARRASEWGASLLKFDYPAQPREALGYSLLLLLGILVRLDLLPDMSPEIEESIAVLETLRAEIEPAVPSEKNPAKELASWLHGGLPTIYGSDLFAPVARRWKGQFNENSKSWAFFEELPEMDHNAVTGTANPPSLAGRVRALFLTSEHDHPRNRLRQEVTRRLFEEAGVPCRTVAGRGKSPLAQVLSTVLLGDATSYYLAMLYRVDPTAIPAIHALKRALAER